MLRKAGVLIVLFLGFVCASPALAKCEFGTLGDARNGLSYSAAQQLSGVTVSSALGQLRKLAVEQNLEVGEDLIDGPEGKLFFIDASKNPPVVVTAVATKDGLVGMQMRIAREQSASTEAIKGFLCNMLGKIQPGAAGNAIAEKSRRDAGSGRAVATTPNELARRVQEMVKKTGAGQYRENAFTGAIDKSRVQRQDELMLPVVAFYIGRNFVIDGVVKLVSNSVSSIDYNSVSFDANDNRAGFHVRKGGHFSVECQMADNQYEAFKLLRAGDSVKLGGVVKNVTMSGITLGECRQVP